MIEQLKKIVLIGPVYPYKGGISHYTSLLYRTLSPKYETTMVSYKLQYPKFLFKKEQRDYGNDGFKISEAQFWINTANPFNWLISAKKIRNEKPDLVIIQWWHPYFAPCYWAIAKLLGKCKVMFICHNVFPHERFPFDHFFTRLTLGIGNYFVVQSNMDGEDLKSIKKNPVFRKAVHPTYNVFKQKGLAKEEGRNLLGIGPDVPVLLFFGFIREYKGLKHLINAMPEIKKQLPDIKLLIVGDFDGDKEQYLELIEKRQVLDVIDIYDGYIPDNEVEKFFAACDLVVLPYESATQSGIVQIAYGFEKPVIATNVGGLPEVVEDGKTGYVVESENPEKLSTMIIKYFLENNENEFKKNIEQGAYRYSWDRIVDVIEELVTYDTDLTGDKLK